MEKRPTPIGVTVFNGISPTMMMQAASKRNGKSGQDASKRPSKQRSRRWRRVFLWGLFGGLVVLTAAGFWLYQALSTRFKGYTEEEKLLWIPAGTRTETTLNQLHTQGIIESKLPVWLYLAWHRDRGGVKAGEYRFHGAMTSVEVAERLIQGKVHQHGVTIPEGLTVWQTAELLHKNGLGSLEESLEAVKEVRLIADMDPAATDLEGYLYPETYFYVRGTGPRELVTRMVRGFRQRFEGTWQGRATELGLDVRRIVTLASLIEKETAVASERPIVSAVFHHRLAKGILLQCDPTIIYASTLIGKFDGKIRQSDMRLDSPYNTYLYPGLPPGPIASPGAKSLEAALYPADVGYLYFVAKDDGTHHFSETLEAHNRAVRMYQR